MASTLSQACPRCRRSCAEDELVCGLSGELLRRAAVRRPPTAEQRLPVAASVAHSGASGELPAPAGPDVARAARRARLEPWVFLGLGALTGPVFGLTPLLGYMGWFLASLVHEMGHAAFAWLCGMPAFPAIALDGHAAAMHGEQSLMLTLLVALALSAAAWHWLAGVSRWVALALVAVGYPALALTQAKDVLHLLAGHGGELTFATLALWKTLDGGFTRSRPERLLYGTVGWFLLGRNAFLCWGLMKSEAARADYYTSGSFGMTNDYVRVAEDLLYWRLESVAALMLLATALALPTAIAIAHLTRGRFSAED